MKTKPKDLTRFVQWKTAVLAAAAVAILASTPALAGDSDNDGDDLKFDLVPSKGLPDAALKGALKNVQGKSAPAAAALEGASAILGSGKENSFRQLPDGVSNWHLTIYHWNAETLH
jgi:hypothetical protein